MFVLDSLMVSGLRWVLETVQTAADTELNDDGVLREQLLEAEMRRDEGEISDAEFADIEADLLERIRESRERREGGAGPLALAGVDDHGDDAGRMDVEASVAGDFHETPSTPSPRGRRRR